MKAFSIAAIAATTLTGFAIADSGGIPGYTTVELSWEVQATVDGPPIILNGTVEQVHAQLLKINPNFDTDVAPIISASTRAESAAKVTKRGELRKRDYTICGYWASASKPRIQEGISYLWTVGGRPRNGPGPGNCGRVSCSYNSAIWWCNDNTSDKELYGFWQIANGAQVVINDCASGSASWVSGQRFHDDHWNVIVRGDSC